MPLFAPPPQRPGLPPPFAATGNDVAGSSRIPPRPRTGVRPLWPGPAGPSPRTARRLCELAAFAAASAFAVSLPALCKAGRDDPKAVAARQSAMYLAHVAFGLSYSAIGRSFGRDRTTAAHACRVVEERRDDPDLDAAMSALEAVCGALRRRLDAPVPA